MLATHSEELGIVFQDDAEAVSFAAGLLDISEFRLFEIAYENWFGSKPSEKTMDAFFRNYLKSGLIPFWLRNLVRTIIFKYRQGTLTLSRFAIDPPCISRSKKRIGWLLLGCFYLLVFVIVWGSATYQPY